jgi:hypothetical protein
MDYCWLRSDRYSDVTDSDWKAEPESLPDKDPLFAAALRTKPSIFVEDIAQCIISIHHDALGR